jgi:aminoglycoside 3-N-acetyltransferase
MAVRKAARLNTLASLTRDLEAAGVHPGMTLMVHSSLSSVGYIVGGPVAMIRALLEVLGAEGTLAMPCETPQISDPALWHDARVDPAWHDTVREHLPVFDPLTTPTMLGALPEAFRTFPGTRRSDHPLVSVCARGVHGSAITAVHSLSFCEGRGTPFEKLYELDTYILLMGVGFDRCTALHYAESLVPNRRITISRYPMLVNGRRVWVEKPDMQSDHGTHFPTVGARFLGERNLATGRIGDAATLLVSYRDLVDFAAAYLRVVLSAPTG